MQSELNTPVTRPETLLTSELIFHEEQALRRLRRETHLTLRAAIVFASRVLRLFALLFERVELVREVAPGLPPLTKDQWETRAEPRILF